MIVTIKSFIISVGSEDNIDPTVPNCLSPKFFVLILCQQNKEFALNQFFLAPEVNADVIFDFFPLKSVSLLEKTNSSFQEFKNSKNRQIRLCLSRTKGLYDPIKVENYRTSY